MIRLDEGIEKGRETSIKGQGPGTARKARRGIKGRIHVPKLKGVWKKRRPIRPLPILKQISPADLLTLANFLCGVLAVMLTVDGGDGLRIAMVLILLGIIFDGLDGPVARRWGSSHKFGKWLDSIADAMTFCIAPAVLVYHILGGPEGRLFQSLQVFLVMSAAVSITILGILRLARFSIAGYRFKDFIGLPTPAMAMIALSFSAFVFWSRELGWKIDLVTDGQLLVIPVLLLAISFTMVSDIQYIRFRGRRVILTASVVLIMLVSLLVGVKVPEAGMVGTMLFFISSMVYLISPLKDGPTHIWGASKRMSEAANGNGTVLDDDGRIAPEDDADEDRA